MTTKQTPATPLPWGEAGQLYSNARRVVHKGNPVVDANGPKAPQDIHYIAHACNAYPRLVAALNGLLSERNAIAVELAKHTGITMTDHGERERCYALLRELGESE